MNQPQYQNIPFNTNQAPFNQFQQIPNNIQQAPFIQPVATPQFVPPNYNNQAVAMQQTTPPQANPPYNPSNVFNHALIPFNPLKAYFDIELHKLRKQSAIYFRWGPNYERQGLILDIRNIMTSLLKEHIRYTKSKTVSRLYEIDTLIESLRVLWFDYYELGYLNKPLKEGRQESQIRALKRYDLISTQINKLGSIIGTKIKAAKQNTKQ